MDKSHRTRITAEHQKAAQTLRELILAMSQSILKQGGSLADIETLSDCKVSVFLTMIEAMPDKLGNPAAGGDL